MASPNAQSQARHRHYVAAVGFGVGLSGTTGIIKKLASMRGSPTPRLIRRFTPIVPEGRSIVSTLIAARSWEEFEEFLTESGGTVASKALQGQGPCGAPLTEFACGHALYRIRKTDPTRTMLDGFFRSPDLVGLVAQVYERVKQIWSAVLELMRFGGELGRHRSLYFTYERPEQRPTSCG
jgi:hypothetical protein